ncbi:hypothetical protein C4546_01245 [Candidatus Parcubacteria bacterium]|jgi:hypothetical protein|nr:MAG: hypothetical protein C4546_01245 [Candidatus Parcubacteria bacterium]
MENSLGGENSQIQQWLSQARQAGFSNEQIRSELTKSGWNNDQIKNLLGPELTPSQLVKQELQASQNASTLKPQPKFKNLKAKSLAIMISAIIGLLVLGGLAFAGWKGYLPIPFLGNNSEKILTQIIKGLDNVRNAEVGAEFRLAAEAKNPAYQNLPSLNKNSSSSLATNPLNSLPPDALIDGHITFFGKTHKITDTQNLLDEGSGIMMIAGSYTGDGQKYSLDYELRYLDKKLYFIIRQMPSIPLFDLTAFKDQWFYVDQQTLGESASDLGFSNVNKNFPNSAEVEKLKTEINILAKFAIKSKALVLKNSGVEAIDGQAAQKISVALNRENYPAMIEAYRTDAGSRNVSIKQIEEFLNKLNAPLTKEEVLVNNYIKELSLNFWFNKSDFSPRKFELAAVLLPEKPAEKIKDKQFRMTVGVNLNHINEQPNVEVPQEAKSLEEILVSLSERRVLARDQ